MILLLSLIFSLFLVILVFFENKKNKDLFSPLKLSILFIFMYNVPFFINFYFDKDILDIRIENKLENADQLLITYIIYMFLSVAALYLGVNFPSRKAKLTKKISLFTLESEARYLLAATIIFSVGLFSYISFIQSIGGFAFWFNNIANRASFTTGNGYSTLFINFIPLGVYFFIGSFVFKKTVFKKVILLFLIIFTFLILTTLGGRKSSIEFVIFCIIIWNYKIGTIKKVKRKIIFISPLFIFYMIAVPILRTNQNLLSYINDLGSFVKDVFSNVTSIITEISYVGHYLFIMEHFKENNFWLGKTFTDLFFVVVPRSIYPDKPPVDDGVYIKSLVEGMSVEPNTPYRLLYQSSLPPETFGNMYLNFGVLGIIIGMFLLGLIYKKAYDYMLETNHSLFSILIYANIIISFQLSNLRITQLVSDVFLYVIIFGVFFTFDLYKKDNLPSQKEVLE